MKFATSVEALSIVIILSIFTPAQVKKPNPPKHPHEVLINEPEAVSEAKKHLGHCGDAQTQDVLNACFAMEAHDSDEQMNRFYRKISSGLKADLPRKQQLVVVQRAWLEYRDLQCNADAATYGGGSMEPMVRAQCVKSLTDQRIETLKGSYDDILRPR